MKNPTLADLMDSELKELAEELKLKDQAQDRMLKDVELGDSEFREPAECWEGCDDPYCPYTHPSKNKP